MGKPLLIVIAGPTASGKTATAIRLAEHLNTEIISADSRQIYQELRIGVARPSQEELLRIPHHFIASRSIADPYSAVVFEKDALHILELLFKSHQYVVVSGGTGLYIQALLEGIEAIPALNPEESNRIRSLSHEAQLDALLKLDPQAESIIDTKNPRRVQRALEQTMASGKKLGEIRTGHKTVRPFDTALFVLEPGKELLDMRITSRIDHMFTEGLVEEAKTVYPFRHLSAVQTVGYQELFPYFEGSISLQNARDQILINTRRYAKRQRTWFRNRTSGITINAENDELAHQLILQHLNNNHGN